MPVSGAERGVRSTRLSGMAPIGRWPRSTRKRSKKSSGQSVRLAQVVDGLADVPVIAQRHHVALHETPGAVLGPGQALPDACAPNPGQAFEDGLLHIRVQRFHDFDRIVRGHRGNRFGRLFRSQAVDDTLDDGVVQFHQDVRIERLAQDIDQAFALGGGDPLQQIGRIRGVQRLRQPPRGVLVAGVERPADSRKNGAGRDVGFAVAIRIHAVRL